MSSFIRDTVMWCMLIIFWTELIYVFSCSWLVCLDFSQFDADRDEDEVFYDISMAVDSKLFPNKEAAAGKSPCPLGYSTPWSPAKCLGLCSNTGLQHTAVRLWGWCCPHSFIPSGLKIKVQNNIEKSHISGSYGYCLSSSHCTGKLADSHNIA